MIVAAGLLVLVGLGLFVAGLLTEVTAFYWACVAVCVVAAVLLYLVRRRMTSPPAAAAPTGAGGGATAASATTATPAPAEQVAPVAAAAAESSATVSGPPAAVPEPAPAAAAPTVATPAAADQADGGEPPVEEVEVTDLLLVVDLKDEVLVVDEHPRYHVEGCRHLTGRDTIPIPLDEARTDGFTPCGTCRPDAMLAARVRSRR
ncbi:hypothetical protein DQ239_06045 [Blastococcus sp. TF02-09]|uniref:hypothetical protein n=1 Tax=Blastococcus sp. TF02-09 TaxID=2250576 RepID=UPI000DEAEE54|nr:hypothetical protein [Blastococcus sp. TF02-9]RBY79209.1 hypothetical protein DQ239_06045 [Blastococcus sp. TF02-9]